MNLELRTEIMTFKSKLSDEIIKLSINKLFENKGYLTFSYNGNARNIRDTIEKIGIPNSWPNNPGEKALYLFREKIKTLEGYVKLEIDMRPEAEKGIMRTIKKIMQYEDSMLQQNGHLLDASLTDFHNPYAR